MMEDALPAIHSDYNSNAMVACGQCILEDSELLGYAKLFLVV